MEQLNVLGRLSVNVDNRIPREMYLLSSEKSETFVEKSFSTCGPLAKPLTH
jgi:hypothetical protein